MTFIGWKSIGFFLIIFEAKEKVALIMREREREREEVLSKTSTDWA